MNDEPVEIIPFALEVQNQSSFLDFRPSVVEGAPKDFNVGVSFGEGEKNPSSEPSLNPFSEPELEVQPTLPETLEIPETPKTQETLKEVDPIQEILDAQKSMAEAEKSIPKRKSPTIPTAPSIKA